MAVVVLYKEPPAGSKSLSSLVRILNADPDLATHFALVVYDNSPEKQVLDVTASFPVTYQHDPTNEGLATAFNFALGCAARGGFTWLLLFDQDTSPTEEFFHELIRCSESLALDTHVGSIVPKLLVSGRIYSPEAHFIDQLRHQYRRTSHSVQHDTIGIQDGRLSAYNSGATFKVSALSAIGGFPREYWLDYLDHAVFHALSTRHYSMFVMQSGLNHEVSQADITKVPVWRQRNVLWAQTLFVKQNGNFFDRLLYRLWVLRYSRSLWIHYPDRRLWKEALLQSVLLQTRTERAPKSDS